MIRTRQEEIKNIPAGLSKRSKENSLDNSHYPGSEYEHLIFIKRLKGAILGIASPLCMYGTIPLAASVSKSGMRDDWLAAFMITGPATKITNLGALKIVFGIKRFLLYLAFVMVFAFLTGVAVNVII